MKLGVHCPQWSFKMGYMLPQRMLAALAIVVVSVRGAYVGSTSVHRHDQPTVGHALDVGSGHVELVASAPVQHDTHEQQDYIRDGPHYMPNGGVGGAGGDHLGGHGGHDLDHGAADGHHSSDGHGHTDAHFGDGHHGGHHEGPHPCAMGLAWMLFATVAWVISLFYFINWPDHDIRQATWNTLNSMIAIFCAVLLFSASTRTLQEVVGGGFGQHHYGPPPTTHLIIAYTRFFVLFLALQLVFHFFKNDPWKFKYFAAVGCHIVGFSAIDAFGETLHLEFFSGSLFMSCVGVFYAWCFLTVVFSSAAKFRDTVQGSHQWKEECGEAESDGVALALGLLTSMLIRYEITGYLPPVHGAPKDKTNNQVWALLWSALLVAPLVVLASVIKHYLAKRDIGNTFMEMVETFQVTIRMTMGWSLLFWGYWCFYNRAEDDEKYGGKLGQRIVMAVVFSAIVFAAIVGIDKIADLCRHRDSDTSLAVEEGFRALLVTFALLMGLSWEATFAEAVNAVSLEYPPRSRMWIVVSLSTGLCIIVLPAWALYILPNALEPEFETNYLNSFSAHEHPDLESKEAKA